MSLDEALETVGTRLQVAAAACLPERFPDYACGLCADACPSRAIRLEPGQAPTAAAHCSGCGQCAAACPSGALHAKGFDLPAAVAAEAAEIRIDCWRVPQGESDPQSLRVPCLAGLDAGWLAALFDRSGERPIHLLDRGGCAGCPAGAGMKALRSTLAEVRMHLFEAGAPMESLPTLTFMPSRIAFADGIPAQAAEQRMGRRAFFRGLAGSLARSAEALGSARDAAEPIVLRHQGEPLGRLRLVTALENIARRHGRSLPSRALPQLSLGECAGHGVCAKVCPTGALQRQVRGDEAELTFFAARCIACGQCARSCPDRALRLQPTGGSTSVEVLARWKAKTCTGCNEAFFGEDGTSCPACRKNQQLSQGMAALFRPRI